MKNLPGKMVERSWKRANAAKKLKNNDYCTLKHTKM